LLFRKQWGRNSTLKNTKIRRITIGGKCPFAGNNECGLAINVRPLDCIGYPVFPLIKYFKNKRKEVIGLLLHKSCLHWQEIAQNKNLLHLIKEFWNLELKEVQKEDIRAWFGHKRNYWLDKNIVKITDD